MYIKLISTKEEKLKQDEEEKTRYTLLIENEIGQFNDCPIFVFY